MPPTYCLPATSKIITEWPFTNKWQRNTWNGTDLTIKTMYSINPSAAFKLDQLMTNSYHNRFTPTDPIGWLLSLPAHIAPFTRSLRVIARVNGKVIDITIGYAIDKSLVKWLVTRKMRDERKGLIWEWWSDGKVIDKVTGFSISTVNYGFNKLRPAWPRTKSSLWCFSM